MVFLADFAVEGESNAFKLFGQRFRVGFFSGCTANCRGLHLVDDGLIGLSGLNGQLARQKEIAAIALSYFDHLSTVAKFRNIFFQNDFHFQISNETYYRAANGSRAMLRARLMAAVRRR